MKQTQYTPDQITKIVRISMLFNEDPDTYMDGIVHWFIKDKGEINLDFNTNEVQMVDFVGSTLDYCCVEGITKGMEIGDYFTER
jgi:hypothetical protein